MAKSEENNFRAQFETVLEQVSILTKAKRAATKAAGGPRFKVITLADIPADFRARYEVNPDGDQLGAYRAGIHLWALNVAPKVTFTEWLSLVQSLESNKHVRSPTGLFERIFDGMEMADGRRIVA